MRVAATNVLPGDRVRGLGLVVDFSEPESDFVWSVTGHYTARDQESGEIEVVFSGVKVVMPNDHQVNVVRADANFRADRVRWAQEAIQAFDDTAGAEGEEAVQSLESFIGSLLRVANAPRGRHLERGIIRSYVLQSYESGANTSAEQLVDDLDAILEPEPTNF